MIDKNKVGLAFGLFLAIMHAVWSLAVAVITNQLQSFLNWIFDLHMIVPIWKITAFNLMNAVLLVIVTFISGYILGWIFAACHNLLHKK